MAAETAMGFQDITQKGIYSGKFTDRSPCLRPAGKLTASPGDSTSACLITTERPPSPDVIRKFRASMRPEAGRSRVFYGRAGDPQRRWAEAMTHGVVVEPTLLAGDLLNPRPRTLFTQTLVDKRESLYSSHRRAPPVGRSHDQRPGLPRYLNPTTATFGIPTEKFGTAGELVSPPKSRVEVNLEHESGRELYRRTHADYLPGEQKTRRYASHHYHGDNKFGVPTPHDNTGKNVNRSLRWLHDALSEKKAPIVSRRVDAFRERTQPQLGKVHDPIKDTMHVAPDHTFGIMVKPDEYGVGDLIHSRVPGSYLRGKDRMRGVAAAIRQNLKKANFHNFENILQAFRHYDSEGTGRIRLQDLRRVCLQFNLPAEPELLEQILDYCDQNKEGHIDYVQFANFLNWKDKMPSGLPQSAPAVLVNPQELDRWSSPRTLQKQIDHAVGNHQTSAAMVNAIVGGVPSQGYRSYGVPTVRTDLAAPRVRRVSDRKNYGDESDTYGLLNPSIYSLRGVYEKDFLIPRPKEELFQIFCNSGVRMTRDDFDDVYNMAASQHPRAHVCVESVRGVLDRLQAQDIQRKQEARVQ